VPSLNRIIKLSVAVVTAMVLVATQANAVPPGTDDEIRERLTPMGSLCRAGEDCGTATAVVASGPLSGEAVYSQFCFACHATGASDAPLFADSEAWAPRIAKGMETLMASTLNGLGMMPAKGTCMNCSDDELQAAVDYMLEEAQ
jgi:cytochrome c5